MWGLDNDDGHLFRDEISSIIKKRTKLDDDEFHDDGDNHHHHVEFFSTVSRPVLIIHNPFFLPFQMIFSLAF